MKEILPALLGGLLAGAFAWTAQSLEASHLIVAASAAVGGFLGVATGQRLKR